VRDEVERAVRKRKRGGVAVLEPDTLSELRRRLASRFRKHGVREIDSDDLRAREAARDRKRALAGARTEVERCGRSRVDRSQRSLVRREVRGIAHRVPADGNRVELLANERAKETPEPRTAQDGVRRQARELLAENPPVQNASR
jgi:protein required for attachment to host cells